VAARLTTGGIVGGVVVDAVLESLEHHAVGSFDLAVAPWVGDRGVVDVDEVILEKVLKDRASEGCTQVGDDPVGYTEVMFDVSDELNSFFRRYFHNRSNFNPLGEFVYDNQDMFVAARGGTKRSHNVETPHREGYDGGIVHRT
jgi:hypothetical protein